MEYSITSQEIGQFYNNRYTKESTDKAFLSTHDNIDMDILKMSVSEWKTPELKAHLIQTKAEKDIQITGGVNGEFAMLHFVCEGETSLGNKQVYPSVINRNANNLFCATKDNINHTFRKSENNIYFKVFLPYSYIKIKTEQYPDVFGTLSTMIKNQCPVLKEGNLATTLEMKTVIEQIKNSSVMGALAPFYFETKIQELLILQLQQMSKYSCAECKCQKHYHEQLNEARNLIEIRYQAPPTIAQLAQHIGMSETVLKTNFKNYFGTTIYGYLFDYRMGIAKKLLFNSAMTIAEIGDKTGYEHPSHFTTAFKRKFGVSPVEYRARRA